MNTYRNLYMKIVKLLPFTLLLLIVGCLDTTEPEYDDSEDQAYLEEYSQREGVTTTNSGLMYRVIEEGDGEIPQGNQQVIVDYTGESVRQDVQYGPRQGWEFEIFIPDNLTVFPGLGEGVKLMKEGARYEFVIPSELAQGNGRVYTFDMKLLSFIRDDQEQFLIDNAELEGVEETTSGLQYRVIEEGNGESPTTANSVKVKYTGTFTSGFVFDESPEGETVEFGVSGVIPGFSEGLQLMKEGGKYELFVPAELGYGNQYPQFGNVLIFEVELEEVL